MSVLKNVVVNWAWVQEPNTQFEHAWEIQAVLTPAHAEQLKAEIKALGVKAPTFKEDEDGNEIYRFRRKVVRADGKTENKAPTVIDPKGKSVDKRIGNGSICDIQYLLVAYANKFGKGVTSDLKGVLVRDLVEYTAGDGSEFDIEDDEDSDELVPKKAATKPPKAKAASADYDDDLDDDI